MTFLQKMNSSPLLQKEDIDMTLEDLKYLFAYFQVFSPDPEREIIAFWSRFSGIQGKGGTKDVSEWTE